MIQAQPNTRRLALLVSLAASSFSGCAIHHAPKTLTAARPVVDQTLGAGDTFDVRVFEEPELSNTYRIDSNGSIDFPLVGRVQVANHPPGEIAQMLTVRLQAFVRSPQISVMVKEINSKRVSIYGQVQKPGSFPYSDSMTISQLISLAGGFTGMAQRDRVRIARFANETQSVSEVDLRAIADGKNPNQYVSPGDEIYVPERLF